MRDRSGTCPSLSGGTGSLAIGSVSGGHAGARRQERQVPSRIAAEGRGAAPDPEGSPASARNHPRPRPWPGRRDRRRPPRCHRALWPSGIAPGSGRSGVTRRRCGIGRGRLGSSARQFRSFGRICPGSPVPSCSRPRNGGRGRSRWGRVNPSAALNFWTGTALDGGRAGRIDFAPEAAADDDGSVPGVASPREVVLRSDPGMHDHPCTRGCPVVRRVWLPAWTPRCPCLRSRPFPCSGDSANVG